MTEIVTDDLLRTSFNIATHNGCITITNRNTGNHRTFRIRTQQKDASFAPGERILSLLTGPEGWTGLGFVQEDGRVHLWRKQGTERNMTYVRMLRNPEVFEAKGCEYLYEGACRVCNRALTNPISIESGIGPICAGRQ